MKNWERIFSTYLILSNNNMFLLKINIINLNKIIYCILLPEFIRVIQEDVSQVDHQGLPSPHFKQKYGWRLVYKVLLNINENRKELYNGSICHCGRNNQTLGIPVNRSLGMERKLTVCKLGLIGRRIRLRRSPECLIWYQTKLLSGEQSTIGRDHDWSGPMI